MKKILPAVLSVLLLLGAFHAARSAIQDWADSDAANTTVDSVSIAEGMPPSNVNNAMREILTEVSKFFKQYVNASSGHDKGSVDAYAISPAIIGTRASVISGAVYRLKANETNTISEPTLSISGETGITIKKISGLVLEAGDIQKNMWHEFVYDGTYYNLLNPYTISRGQLASTITFSELQEGPEGALITFNSSSVATLITQGSSGQVLTSRGTGSTPVFQTFSVSLPVRELFIPVMGGTDKYGQADGDFPVSAIGNGGNASWVVSVPPEFDSLDAITVVVLPDTTETFQYDLDTDCGAIGEQSTTHSQTASNQTKAVTNGELVEIDVSGVFSNLAASDYCGFKFSSDTDIIQVLGLKIRYNWQ